MEAFLEQLQILRLQFDALSSDDHEDALEAVAETVSAMRDASVRRRFEREIELTLAWEAEKMIVERFAGDWTSANPFLDSSTSSFNFEISSTVFENNIEKKDTDFPWDELPNREVDSKRKLSTVPLEESELDSASNNAPNTASGQGSIEESGGREEHIDEQLLSTIVAGGKSLLSTTSHVTNGVSTEKSFICATCGFSANNRKALYRHGLRTKHVLREANTSGSLMCPLCSFCTNKMFNYNRHLRRFHKEVVENANATQCSTS